MDRLIYSLCDYSGAWSQPYVEAGYRVVRVDWLHCPGMAYDKRGVGYLGTDVTKLDFPETPWGVLAAPPCTCFCRPGSRWWKRQDESGATERDVATLRACLRLCQQAEGWWALENPPGRHQKLVPELGPPGWQYQPYDYGDDWSKQTYIWGTAKKPESVNAVTPQPTRRTPNGKTQGRIAFLSSTHKRQRERTPDGFAKAFFEANP